MVAPMIRASLRSVSDPFREHVCLSCLARRFDAPPRLRQYHRTPQLRAEIGENKPEGRPEDAPSHTPSHTPSQLHENGTFNKDHPPDSEMRQSKGGEQKISSVEDKTADSTSVPSGEKPKSVTRKGRNKSRRRKSQGQTAFKGVQEKSVSGSKETREKVASKDTQEKAPSKGGKESDVKEASKRPIDKVKSLLQAGIQKEQIKKNAAQEKPKLSHIASFIRAKQTGSIDSADRKITALDVHTAPVPRLSFGLDRVLFNPGVYQLRDPRSRVYNFDPYLGAIMPVTEFDFNALKDYITSSKDETLRDIAVKEKKKYVGSSSSMTSVLAHFHYLLSAWRKIDTRTLSQGFPEKMLTFTRLLRAPAAMFLHYQDGVYAIDADKEFDSANILMNLGKSMEKLLTLPKEDFERYRRSSDNKISPEEEQAIPESYHYSTSGDFIMRSQLDAYDPRLPGTGMFDLKTRAVVSIRMDAKNFEHGLGYEIKSRFGAYESYEREFYDMIRAAFLKYSLQVRIGRMDGIFVAFHNVERIFGFQYISLPEMDQTLHGQADTTLGDSEFQLSLGLWNKVLDRVTEKFPKKSLRIHFETRDAVTPFMYIFAEPVTQEDINAIQTKNKAEIEAYQRRLLDLAPTEDDSNLDVPPVPETLAEPEATESNTVLYDSDLPLEKPIGADAEHAEASGPEIFGMALTIRNKVNDKYTDRPLNLNATDKWTVDYELSELAPAQARTLYKMCQARREKELMGRGEDEQDVAANVYIRRLRHISKEGRAHRKRENRLDEEKGIVVLRDNFA
ncbi:mitochondrial translation protein [Penicillium hispanicum]|uniref:mitochondrial translation protein n=1 Tax=Penicillium hispanicum TaxID=1080232 RepID=UPI0025414CDF|nr:mitochondrial translation protein [Penicillium hispanicum]KAJ5570285.1 mitochondrial translation protein [Penicillium hispanicum]